jgi:hypothetical protein
MMKFMRGQSSHASKNSRRRPESSRKKSESRRSNGKKNRLKRLQMGNNLRKISEISRKLRLKSLKSLAVQRELKFSSIILQVMKKKRKIIL